MSVGTGLRNFPSRNWDDRRIRSRRAPDGAAPKERSQKAQPTATIMATTKEIAIERTSQRRIWRLPWARCRSRGANCHERLCLRWLTLVSPAWRASRVRARRKEAGREGVIPLAKELHGQQCGRDDDPDTVEHLEELAQMRLRDERSGHPEDPADGEPHDGDAISALVGERPHAAPPGIASLVRSLEEPALDT